MISFDRNNAACIMSIFSIHNAVVILLCSKSVGKTGIPVRFQEGVVAQKSMWDAAIGV
jgi:hypothetical protein